MLGDHLSPLEENFRMNEELCELPRTLYTPNYRPVDRIRNEKLVIPRNLEMAPSQAWFSSSFVSFCILMRTVLCFTGAITDTPDCPAGIARSAFYSILEDPIHPPLLCWRNGGTARCNALSPTVEGRWLLSKRPGKFLEEETLHCHPPPCTKVIATT